MVRARFYEKFGENELVNLQSGGVLLSQLFVNKFLALTRWVYSNSIYTVCTVYCLIGCCGEHGLISNHTEALCAGFFVCFLGRSRQAVDFPRFWLLPVCDGLLILGYLTHFR